MTAFSTGTYRTPDPFRGSGVFLHQLGGLLWQHRGNGLTEAPLRYWYPTTTEPQLGFRSLCTEDHFCEGINGETRLRFADCILRRNYRPSTSSASVAGSRSRRGKAGVALGTLCPGTFAGPGVTTLGATAPGVAACPAGLVCAAADLRG